MAGGTPHFMPGTIMRARPTNAVLLAVALAMRLGGRLEAAQYYVANGGDDGQAGSESAPFATVAYALSQASSGDTVFLQRGSVFREGGLALNSGETLTAYGDPSNALPVLAGSLLATNFSAWVTDPRIYRSDLPPGTAIEQLYVDGLPATLARYPDSGWLRTDTGTGDDLVVDTALTNHPDAAPGRWAGAQLRWRKWSWWYETRPITNDNGQGTLMLGGSTSLGGLAGIDSGYYIDNTLLELDAPGEWFWDGDAGVLYLYPPAGSTPTSMVVEAAWQPVGLSVAGATLDRVCLRHYTDDAVRVNSASTVRGCVLEHGGDTGLSGTWNAGGSTVAYCLIRDILNVGITWNENPAGAGGTVIEHNRFERIGVVPGLGGSGPWHAVGVIISNANEDGNGVRLRRNRILGTGYAGIILGADRQVAERNVLIGCMATLNDGAAIYANAHTNTIRENIILNAVGDLDSSHPWTPLGHGIWPEFLSNFRGSELVGNTVFGCGGHGLFLPNNFDCLVWSNTFLANRVAGLQLGYGEPGRSDGQTNQNHDIRWNIVGMGAYPWRTADDENLESWARTNAHALGFYVYGDRDLDYGTLTDTTFISTNGQDLVYDSDRAEYTIGEWQAAEPAWADPAPALRQGAAFLFVNDTDATIQFPLPADVAWEDLDEGAVSNAVPIAPFRSVVLLAASEAPTNLPGCFLATDYGIADYTNWISLNLVFGTNAVPDADPDQDGLPNFAEYFCNLDPATWDEAPGLTCRYDVPTASFVTGYQRRRYVDGVTGGLEGSTNLAAWSALGGATETAADIEGDLAVQALDVFVAAASNQQFYTRLSISATGE
ncbi:MAG: right-handed parallel beta-helix repeat-containing protein [Kiritimatiellae bacterium]|nr:right-handed parallel beta-helix repeat-containing protein [Kiritimatiellia bacterium]